MALATSVGIDVHGREKGLYMARITWGPSLDGPHEVMFDTVPLAHPCSAAKHGACPVVDPQVLRPLIARGDIDGLAQATMTVAEYLESLLRDKLKAVPSNRIAIDSPSGFARNTLGHGRRTEKARAPFGFAGAYQIYAQMTPSLDVGKPHRGTRWSWVVFGMAAFASLGGRLEGKDRKGNWRDYLGGGPDGSEPLEAFPSATIQFLRQTRNTKANNAVHRLLRGIVGDQTNGPCRLIEEALEHGPSALKGNDKAAALIAALSTLGTVFPDTFEAVPLDDQQVKKHAPAKIGYEGKIILVGARERSRVAPC